MQHGDGARKENVPVDGWRPERYQMTGRWACFDAVAAAATAAHHAL